MEEHENQEYSNTDRGTRLWRVHADIDCKFGIYRLWAAMVMAKYLCCGDHKL